MSKLFVRMLALVSTVLLAWGALTLGTERQNVSLSVGDRATREYRAQRTRDVVDQVSTEALQEEAAAAVTTVTRREPENESQVFDDIEELVIAVREGVPGPEPLEPVPTVPEPEPSTTTTTVPTTTTSVSDSTDTTEGTTTTTEPPVEMTSVEAFLFIDVDEDGVFDPEASEDAWRADFGVPNLRLVVTGPDGVSVAGETGRDGIATFSVPRGTVEAVVDRGDPSYPTQFVTSAGALLQVVECGGETCSLEGVGFAPNDRPLEEQVIDLSERFPLIPESSLVTLATLATQDLVREVADEPLAVDTILFETNKELSELFADGVTSQNVNDVKGRVQSDPPFFNIDGRRNDDAREVVADLIAAFLVPNRVPDEEATNQAREEARADIDPVEVAYFAGDLIAAPGDRLTQLDIDAIRETGAVTGETPREYALLAVITVLVAVLSFYLARFRPQFWANPRMVVLWALLIVLAAGAVRLGVEFEDRATWFVIPAVGFGYLAAVLFDNRMGTLMALALAILAAVGTRDPGVAVYTMLATLTPIGFVSRISSRRAFRNAVIISSAAVAAIAATVAWFFYTNVDESPWAEVGVSTAWAFGVSLLASLVALAAMPFFESMFDITTTLRLLELTDRNHEALQVLQEKAFGTFNHSLMVGTLADTGAKAIGANNLLARAAAYYHDIGKTEDPLYFIENQFGVPNPHDELPPEQSAAIIRKHVTDGVALARRYRIPSEVAEGIVSHHGDAIMRYFYEKARQAYGDENVDPNDYRHAGHKPESREMAIVMMADTVEGACRAVFGDEEPSPEAISKVVTRVLDEKVSDGQLSDSELTMGELTRVKNAFIEALVGHYHQRIPYPNFPGA